MQALAAMCCHVPDKGKQMVRYYGYYSNVSRGRRQKEDQDGLIPYIIELQEDSKEYQKNWARLIQKMGACPRNPLQGIPQGVHIPLEPFSISLGQNAPFALCAYPTSHIPLRLQPQVLPRGTLLKFTPWNAFKYSTGAQRSFLPTPLARALVLDR